MREVANHGEMIVYRSGDGCPHINVRLENEPVWLSIDQMAKLFSRNKSTISRHIKNIFDEGELERNSVVANFATTAADGKTYQVDYYNLDMIIAVGKRPQQNTANIRYKPFFPSRKPTWKR